MNDDARQKKILEEIREFARSEIKPYASHFDKTGVLPKELIRKLADKGYLAASFPEKYGGLELDPVYYGLFTEEIGKSCCSTRALITVHTSLVGETLMRWGSDEQKKEWISSMATGERIGAFALSEPATGSDAQSVQTTYERKGSSYVINGKKKWITFGDVANFFIVIASQNKKITAFLVERAFEGVRTIPIEGMLANRASHIAELEFTDVVIPQTHVIGAEGCGFSLVTNTALDHGRYSIAWAGVAVAQAALEAMVSYSRERTQFGQRIYRFQLIQGMIGDAVTKIHAARALCLKAGKMRKSGHAESIIETAMAKYFSSRVAMEVTTDAVQAHGGEGCSSAYPVERLFREAKVLEIIEGTSQIQQQLIAQYGLRKYHVKPDKGA